MKIIISLTTISDRLELLRYVLYALVNQSVKPDKIYVNISSEAYMADSGVNVIPEWVEDFKKNNVEFRFTENIGPFRKLNPILDIAENHDVVITCDDDVIYGPHWLESLIKCSAEYPNAIVCSQAREIKQGIFRKYRSYIFWNIHRSDKAQPLYNLLPIGAGGILYKKNLIDIDFALDRNFLWVAPLQDDLWYRAASILKDTPVVVCGQASRSFFPLVLSDGLYIKNASIGGVGGGVIISFLRKLLMFSMAYIGFRVTRNDYAWEKINSYMKRDRNY